MNTLLSSSPGLTPGLPTRSLAARAAVVAVALLAGGCEKPETTQPKEPAEPASVVASEVVVSSPRAARLPEYLEVTGRIDELCRDTALRSLLAEAPLDEILHAQLGADLT